MNVSQEPNEDIVSLLLNSGANVNASNCIGETVLHMAVKHTVINVTHEIVKWGADINAQDNDLFTPLIEAVLSNNLEALCLLLYYGADVNLSSTYQLTPFMYAVMNLDRYEIGKILFQYYDTFATITHDGYTALLLAAQTKNPIAVDLVKAGVGVNYDGPRGSSATQLLVLSLLYDDLEFFREVWYRIDLKHITHCPSFKRTLLNNTTLSRKDWVDCVYLLLSSSVAEYLLCVRHDTVAEGDDVGSFAELFCAFQCKGVELADRLQIMYIYLSLGYVITPSDLSAIYRIYDFNEELQLLIDHPISEYHQTANCHPIVIFIFALEEEISTKYVINLIVQYISTNYLLSNQNVKDVVLHVFKFFSICYAEKQNLLERWEASDNNFDRNSLMNILNVPETPCLVELSRNKIRDHLRTTCKVKRSHHFHSVIKRLPIPNVIKDILIFKKPLY
ncbi:hypothetical protein RI129_002029 [Pyrocoelia pectoralis]|uniref:Uncharacterized protein n=1 Tax=Pyrocoelia pectoralis TaxID=417401 RepID=A0AAN7VQ94_9COLE